MKRISAALAVVSAVLLMGTASAKVPDTSAGSRLRQLGIMRPDLTPPSPGSAVRAASALGHSTEGVDAGVLNTVADAVEDGALLTDDLLAGLPPEVAEILGALPFMPGPAQDILPAPVGLVPELTPDPAPAEEPKPEPEAPLAPIIRALPKLRTAAGDQATVFPGLPGTGHAGTTTGSAIHADTITSPGDGTQLEKVDQAFSASTFTSSPIAKTLTNEFARVTSQALGANSGYGRGSGLEVGLAQASSAEPQLSQGRAEAKSPPSTPLVTSPGVGPVAADPVATASALLGQAQSRAAAACTTGVDLSFGRGYAADASLVTSGDAHLIETTSPAPPAPAVSESRSGTRLIPQANPAPSPTGIAKFGLQSETRQILAPVTFFPGTPSAFTLKFAGEWVLRATADGKGVGDVFYGPGTVEPSTPLLTIIQGTTVVQELKFQDIFTQTGLNISLPGVAEIAIGEDPRAIGGNTDSKPTETTTYAAGAVDVARVLLGPDGMFGDIRIGHMEAAVAVPAGGIECGIGLLKKSSHDVVRPGESFTWTVTVTNPNDCVLTSVKVVDTISADAPIRYSLVSSDPKANSESDKGLTWNDVGPIQPGGKKDLLINMKVAPNSGGGLFLDEAVATGVCGPAAGVADAGVGVPLEARVSLNIPRVIGLAEAPLKGELPRTGGLLATLPAFVLLGTGLVLRRLKARRQD